MEENFNYSNDDIMHGILNREISSLKNLYDNYSYSLSSLIAFLVRDQRLSQEILELTFIQAWIEIESFDFVNDSVFIWLLKIMIKVTAQKLDVPLLDMQKLAWIAYKEYGSRT